MCTICAEFHRWKIVALPKAGIISWCRRRQKKKLRHDSINLVSIITGYGRAPSHRLNPQEKCKKNNQTAAVMLAKANADYFVRKPQSFRFFHDRFGDVKNFSLIPKIIYRSTVFRSTASVYGLQRSFPFIIFYFTALPVPDSVLLVCAVRSRHPKESWRDQKYLTKYNIHFNVEQHPCTYENITYVG